MSGPKVTAVAGLKSQDETDSWMDFYTEDDNTQPKETATEIDTKTENERYADDFEPDEVNDTTSGGVYEVLTEINREGNKEQEETPVGRDSATSKKHKHKTKKSKSHHQRPRSASLNKDRPKSPPSRHPHQQTTTDHGRHRGRKLQRRRQMRNEQALAHAVEQSGRDRLEQKYMELEDLMARPLADTGRMSHHQRQKLVEKHHDFSQAGYHDENAAPSREEDGNENNQAYSTIRILQSTTGPDIKLNITYDRPCSAARSPRSPRSRLPPTGHHHRGHGTKATRSPKENGYGGYSSDEDNKSEGSSSRKPYQPTDMHLKHTDNTKLKEWLRQKDIQHRKARREERTKKREERNDKMIEEELKKARREKSSERVKEWLEVKRKEALLRQKVERRRRKQEAEEMKKRAKSQESGIQGTGLDRPQTAPAQKSGYRLIKRPNSANGARLDEGNGENAKPPDSKFVYKRRVTGRVQLMKIQNERNERARSADQDRYEALSSEEKQHRAKTSYDSWLLAKKKAALEEKKAARKKKQLAQSDPELERIIPEMARRRIERVKHGKTTLDTGLGRSTASVEGEGERQEEEEAQPKPPSYRLSVNGVAATVSTPNTRPASARPPARKAVSPRRPKSASTTASSKHKANAVVEKAAASTSSSFKLPFPDDLGAPCHVKRVQERIFSKELTSQSDDKERPEPQGCASAENKACPKGGERVTTQTSLVLLQEIEAEAMQSEQASELTYMAVHSALLKAANGKGSSPAQEILPEEDESDQPGEEPAADSSDLGGDVDFDELQQDNTGAEEPQGEEQEDETEEQEELVEEEIKEDNEVNDEEVMDSVQRQYVGGGEDEDEERVIDDAGDDKENEVDEEENYEEVMDSVRRQYVGGGEDEDEERVIDDAGDDKNNEVNEEENYDSVQCVDGGEDEDEERVIDDAGDDSNENEQNKDNTEEAAVDEEQPEEEAQAEEDEEPQVEEDAEIINENAQEEIAEPDTVTCNEQTIETTAEEDEDPKDGEQTTEPTDASVDTPADVEETADQGQEEQGTEDSDLDTSLRRSLKHVSFSEELATVFEPGSVEVSCSFGNERDGVEEPQEQPQEEAQEKAQEEAQEEEPQEEPQEDQEEPQEKHQNNE